MRVVEATDRAVSIWLSGEDLHGPGCMDPALAAENPYKVFVKIEDHCAQRSGGARLRYTIRVNGRTSYLYQQLVLSD